MNEQDYTRPILWSIRGLVANKKIQIDDAFAAHKIIEGDKLGYLDIAYKFSWLRILELQKELKHLQKAEKHIRKYLDSLA